MILTSTLPAVGVLGVSQVIAAFTARQSIWPGIVITAAALLVIAVVGQVTWPVSDTVEDLVSRQVHDDLLRLTAEIPSIAHHEDPALSDRIGIIEDDVNALVGGPLLLGMLGSVASTITVIGLLASVHPALCLLLGVALLPAFVEARSAQARNEVQLTNERYRRLAQRCVDVLSATRQGLEVRCFGLAGPLLAVSGEAMRQRTRPRIAVTRRFTGYAAASWLVFGAAYAAAVWWTVFRLRDGSAGVGELSLLLLIGAQVVSAGQAITSNTRMVVDQLQVFGRYHWLRDYSERRRWQEATHTPPAVLSDGIRLRGVSFAYPASRSDGDAGQDSVGGRMAVRDVDLHLPAGSTVAFVGPNGAGKSTLVNLLARLYDPTTGTVEVDGVPLTDLDPVAWRERISAGFQDYATFEFTAADSIGVGDVEQRTDRTRLAAAVAGGQAGAVIDGLPQGLDTQLGSGFDGGVDLSGGQWQRLALARAFMRDRPLLMLLDEPTAALDPQAEHALYEQYATTARELARSTRTVTVLVSHRFSTVRMADLIVVVQDGRVSELGSHDELMRAGGHYARLFDLQASAYR
ncbi:ABC transporter ATP-binding protein [Flindersiella endophytica]